MEKSTVWTWSGVAAELGHARPTRQAGAGDSERRTKGACPDSEASLAYARRLVATTPKPSLAGAPRRVRFWRELLYVAAFYLVYNWIGNREGAAPAVALRNALSEVHLEQALGIFRERSVQAWFLPHTGVVKAFDLFYVTAHFAMPVVVLVWVYHRDKARYLTWRNTLSWLTGLALIVFAAFPVMPPWLLPKSFGFVDTLGSVGGFTSWESSVMKAGGDLYAAMPSLHLAWALWCALALVPVVRRRWLKLLVALDPVVTAVVVIATANHYFVDLLAGALVVGMARGLAAAAPFERAARVFKGRARLTRREAPGQPARCKPAGQSGPARKPQDAELQEAEP